MNNIDEYLAMLEKLQVIPERGVKTICEKVKHLPFRLNKSFPTSPI